MSGRQNDHGAVAVYDGLRHPGDTIERAGGRFEAVAADGRGLGAYPNRAVAEHAVLSERHQGAR